MTWFFESEDKNHKYDLSHLTQNEMGIEFGPIQDDEALLLYAVCKVVQAQTIIEFGGLGGYSAKNFLKAMGDEGVLYTVDNNPNTISLSQNHRVIIKNVGDVTPYDFDSKTIDLLFFDCHDLNQQRQAFHTLKEAKLITPDTLLAIHDTGTHPSKLCNWSYPSPYGWIHQPSERELVNYLQSQDYYSIPFHCPNPRPPLLCRHGLTLLHPKIRLNT